jgi:hypothetical protein
MKAAFDVRVRRQYRNKERQGRNVATFDNEKLQKILVKYNHRFLPWGERYGWRLGYKPTPQWRWYKTERQILLYSMQALVCTWISTIVKPNHSGDGYKTSALILLLMVARAPGVPGISTDKP